MEQNNANELVTLKVPERLRRQLKTISSAKGIGISEFAATVIERGIAYLSGERTSNEQGSESAKHLSGSRVSPSDSPNVPVSPQMLEKLRGIIKELQEFHGQLVIPAGTTAVGGGSADEQSAAERRAAIVREAAAVIRDAEVALATAERTRESAKRDPKQHVKPGK